MLEMMNDLFLKGATQSFLERNNGITGATLQEAVGFQFTQFNHRASHHSVTQCTSSSVWDNSMIPHTLCNILVKPMERIQQKLCIFIPLSLTRQIQEQLQARLALTNCF